MDQIIVESSLGIDRFAHNIRYFLKDWHFYLSGQANPSIYSCRSNPGFNAPSDIALVFADEGLRVIGLDVLFKGKRLNSPPRGAAFVLIGVRKGFGSKTDGWFIKNVIEIKDHGKADPPASG